MLHLEKQPRTPNIANGWKEQRDTDKVQKRSGIVQHAGCKNLVKSTKKKILKIFCVCVSLLLNLSLKNADTPPELVKTWHLGTEHFLQVNGLPLIATEYLLWLRPSPHVDLGFQFLSRQSVTCKVEGSDLGLTDQQLKLQHFYIESKTKSPTWEPNSLHSFWPSLHCWPTHASASHKRTANFSALSDWKACTALSTKDKANAALPGHS